MLLCCAERTPALNQSARETEHISLISSLLEPMLHLRIDSTAANCNRHVYLIPESFSSLLNANVVTRAVPEFSLSLCYRDNTASSCRAIKNTGPGQRFTTRTPWTADTSKRMSQQPESPSPSLRVSPAPFSAEPPSQFGAGVPLDFTSPMQRRPAAPRWFRIVVWLLRLAIGVALFYAPWNWDDNFLWKLFPALGRFATIGAVRGLVSGLGFLNLWIAFQDTLRRRMER